VTEPPWVDRQLRHRGIRDERVLAAMARVPRDLFVPESVRAQAQRLTYRPAYCSTIKEETAISSLEDSSATLRKTRVPLGDVPLVILTAGSGYPNDGVRDAWVRGQADLLTLSTRSEQHVIDGATHFNLAIDRVDIVASAARDLLARLGRGRQPGSRL